MEKYNTGIYQIVNQVNGKRYIGSAVNLEQRKISHFNTLTMKIHKNRYLQFVYNKYGKNNLKFEILLYCDKENLLFYEQRSINSYNFKELYNISKTAGSNLGMKFSEEHKAKIGMSNRGKKYSEEAKKKMLNH
jgi:group I intron endonuclease